MSNVYTNELSGEDLCIRHYISVAKYIVKVRAELQNWALDI